MKIKHLKNSDNMYRKIYAIHSFIEIDRRIGDSMGKGMWLYTQCIYTFGSEIVYMHTNIKPLIIATLIRKGRIWAKVDNAVNSSQT